MPDFCDVRFGWSGSAVYPAVHTLGTRSQSWQPLMLLSETVIDGEENIWASSVSAKGLIENKNPPQETQGGITAAAPLRAARSLLRNGLMYSCKMAARKSASKSDPVFCKKPQCSDFLCLPLIPLFFSFLSYFVPQWLHGRYSSQLIFDLIW